MVTPQKEDIYGMSVFSVWPRETSSDSHAFKTEAQVRSSKYTLALWGEQVQRESHWDPVTLTAVRQLVSGHCLNDVSAQFSGFTVRLCSDHIS